MAPTFPNGIKSYTPKAALDVIPSAEWNSFQEEITAIETNLYTGPQVISSTTAWQTLPGNPTWTYASATTFTIATDLSGFFPVGAKIRLTNSTVKYFYVVSASYGAPNTTVTVTGGSDYSLANAAITSPYISYASNPHGFPQWFNFTPVWSSSGTQPAVVNGTLTGIFCIIGRKVTADIELIMGAGTTYGTGTYGFSGPTAIPGTGRWPAVGEIVDTSTNTLYSCWVVRSTSWLLRTHAVANGVSATVPITFATTDVIRQSLNYQI